MSKLFNMISKGQGKGVVQGGGVERVTPMVQLEIPLDLPPPRDDNEPEKKKRRAYKKTSVPAQPDPKDLTIAGLREQISSLQKKIAQENTSDQAQQVIALQREAEAAKQMLERTQKELEEAREWQAEPGAPKFRQRESELLMQIEKMTAESAGLSSSLQQAKDDLAELRAKHTRLVAENETVKSELSETLGKLAQKQAEQTSDPESAQSLPSADENSMTSARDAAARENLLKPDARPAQARRGLYYAAALLLALMAVAGFYYRRAVQYQEPEFHAVAGNPLVDRLEHNLSLRETGAGAVLPPQPEAEPRLQDESQPVKTSLSVSDTGTGTPGSSGQWPLFDLPGIKIEQTPNACFVTFQHGLFDGEAALSERGMAALSSVSRVLAPYSGELCLIVVGHTDLSADSDYDHGTLAMKRAEAVRDILVSKAYFSESSIIVRRASAPSVSISATGEHIKNRNQTADIRLVRRTSIARE